METFDLYIAYVAWETADGIEGKRRPVMMLGQAEDNVAVYYVTSQYSEKSSFIQSKYFPIVDWQQAGLDKQSYIDTVQIRRLAAGDFLDVQPIGKLSELDIIRLQEFLSNKD
jgi:hypothetical protein